MADFQDSRLPARRGAQHVLQTSRLLSLVIFMVSLLHNKSFLELRELVDLHGEKSEHNEEPLSSDEVLIIKVVFYYYNILKLCNQFMYAFW